MPLSEPQPRRHIHTRRVEMNGYQRDDGLWDIEARLVDTKGYAFTSRFRGEIPAGEPVHDMSLRLTLDDSLTIHAVEACTDYSPFPSCPQAAPRYEALVGLRIGPGWMAKVKSRLPNVSGCTHLFELLRPVATTAYQTIGPLRDRSREPGARPSLLDTCHGWRANGEAVQAIHPDWYRDDQGQ